MSGFDTKKARPYEPPPEEPWPDLVPFDRGEPPRLAPDMLGDELGRYAHALAAFTETPLELAAGLALGAVSTAAARRLRTQVKPGYHEPANLWLLPSLAPGNRKSSVQKIATAPILEWETETAKAMAIDIEIARSETEVAKARAKEKRAEATKAASDLDARNLAREAAEIEQAAPEILSPLQLWTSDATPEQLGVLLAANKERMAWLSAEGGLFEIFAGRYSNGAPNLDLMLKAHSGDSERVNRVGRDPVFLREPLLTIAMSPQPELLRGLTQKPGFRGRGLLARFLYFLPPSPLGYRSLEGPPIPEAVAKSYRQSIRAMLDWPEATDVEGDARHIVRLSAKAEAERKAFARHVEALMRPGEDFEQAQDWAGKAPGAAVRLTTVIHGFDHALDAPWEHEISADTMERATAIMGISALHTLAVFDLMAVDRNVSAATKLWDWTRRKRNRAFSARDAWQGVKGTGGFSRMADVYSALEVLEERGFVRASQQERDGPGRPKSPMVEVRPDLAEGWE